MTPHRNLYAFAVVAQRLMRLGLVSAVIGEKTIPICLSSIGATVEVPPINELTSSFSNEEAHIAWTTLKSLCQITMAQVLSCDVLEVHVSIPDVTFL